MKIQASESGVGPLTNLQLKQMIKDIPDDAVLTMAAGADQGAGTYLVKAEWDPKDTKVTHVGFSDALAAYDGSQSTTEDATA